MKKKPYRSPVLFDLSAMEAIGACALGSTVSDCITGGIYQLGCTPGSDVKPLNCSLGNDAWRKSPPRR